MAVASEYTDLIKRLNALVNEARATRAALSSTLAIHKPRIFQQGFDARGAKIGEYSTKATSIAKKSQARQTGQTYFKGGYAEYKRMIGKNPGFVILRNTDQMFMDYGLMVFPDNTFGFGFNNDENYRKSKWMEQKYSKKIFDLSNYETEVLANVLVAEVKKIL